MHARNLITLVLCASAGIATFGQTQTNTTPTHPALPQLPFPAQLKKTVVFIRTDCVHMPTDEELAAMSPEEQARWTSDNIAKLKPEELARLKQESHFGTGFLVLVPDDRLPKSANDPPGNTAGFTYLVTNRHVVQPGVEGGRPCKVVNRSISVNLLLPSPGTTSSLMSVPLGSADAMWRFPDDDSADLAAMLFSLPQNWFDAITIPISMFVTQEMIDKGDVVEGDPVIFTGLFVQYSGRSRLEPVVRSGTIAMLPTELVPTTLRKLGHLYFTEAHAFGGNSGSPIFVDVNRFKNSLGFDYRFLGVVTGEVYETSDLTLQITTSYTGTIAANSNVSVIVPAFQVRDLLLSKPLQQQRDAFVAQTKTAQPTK